MRLKSYQTPSVSVDLGDGGEHLQLHALTSADTFALFRNYKAELSAFYDTMIELNKTGQFSLADSPALAASMLENVPDVAAHAIALSAREYEPEAAANAKTLPLPVQLEVLEKIWRLTFDGTESVKKALEAVIRYSQGATGLLNEIASTPEKQPQTAQPQPKT